MFKGKSLALASSAAANFFFTLESSSTFVHLGGPKLMILNDPSFCLIRHQHHLH